MVLKVVAVEGLKDITELLFLRASSERGRDEWKREVSQHFRCSFPPVETVELLLTQGANIDEDEERRRGVSHAQSLEHQTAHHHD